MEQASPAKREKIENWSRAQEIGGQRRSKAREKSVPTRPGTSHASTVRGLRVHSSPGEDWVL